MEYAVDATVKIPLNGYPQKIHIRSLDVSHPVLLFLHGGPGLPNRHTVMGRCNDLTDAYTLVAWDQRGAGGSRRNLDISTLNLQQFVSDARALVDYLCGFLEKKSVYLVCSGFGTVIGTLLCSRFPEKIAGYFGFGQAVNGALSEELAYARVLEKAMAAQNQKDIDMLMRMGPPVDGLYRPAYDGLVAVRKLMKHYGLMPKPDGVLARLTPAELLSSEYNTEDRIAIGRGNRLTLETMWPTAVRYQFSDDCARFQIPFYIAQGRLDGMIPFDMIEDYAHAIQAPKTELIWLDKCGSDPLSDDPDACKQLIRERLL